MIRGRLGSACETTLLRGVFDMAIGSRKSILVIEDDAVTRDAVALALQDEGYSVIGVANGQEALLHLCHAEPPNLILLDLMMPVMNGWEFRKHQAQDPALKSIPVVIVSADARVPQKAAAEGFVSLLRLQAVDGENDLLDRLVYRARESADSAMP